MMLTGAVLVLSLATVVLSGENTIQLPPEWHLWKAEHGKNYNSFSEELQKHITWKSNHQYIDAHNSHKEIFGFTLKMNQFGDLSDVEFNRQYSCVEDPFYSTTLNSSHHSYEKIYHPPLNYSLPEMVDWRSMGAVSSVKSQGECCSCYAFSAVESLEGVYALATDRLVELSAQNVLDCSEYYGNNGCKKGSTSIAFSYIIGSNGVDTDKSYPYEGEQGACRFNHRAIGARMRNYIRISPGDEAGLKAAVAFQGPVSVTVDASQNMFRFYSGGVLSVPNCSWSKPTQAMIIIGYGTRFNRDYWLVKNSWGESWGMRGFGLLSRNRYNQCGIATRAIFPSI